MTAPYLPHSAPSRKSPADVWEDLVARGMSPDAATAAVAQQFKMPAPKMRGFGQGALDVGNELLQGASFGWADEAAGLVSPKLGDAMRQRSEDLHKANPTAALAANVLGGLATGGGIAKLGMKAFPRLAGSGLKAAALRGAANVGEGAVTGAIGGAGAGTTPEGKLSGALAGGLIGGVTGGAIPGAAALAKGARRAILPYSQRGASKVADEMIGQAIEDAGRIDLPVDGKPLQLVDRLGEPGRKLARGARTTSAAARQTLADLSTARMPGAAKRVMQDVNEGLGVGGQTVRQIATGLDDARTAIANAEYTPARMAQEVPSPSLVATLEKSKIYRRAHRAMRDAAEIDPNAAPVPALFGKDGKLVRNPTVEDIETIRKGLADIEQTGGYVVSSKTLGPQVKNLTKQQKKAVTAARKAMLDDAELNAVAPWYKPARAQLASKHAEGRALKLGETMDKALPEDVADVVGGLGSPQEQQMYRASLSNKIRRKVNESPAIAASRVAGGGPTIPGRMDRLQAAAQSPEAFGRMRAGLQAEDQIAATERFLGGQSETADKAAEAGGITLRALLSAVKGGANAAMVPMAAIAAGNTGKVSKELARKLANLTPDEQQLYLRYVQDYMAKQLAKRTTRQALTAGAIGGGMGGAR